VKEDRRGEMYELYGSVPMPPLLESLMISLHRTLVLFERWDDVHSRRCFCEWCVPIRGFHFSLELCWDYLGSSISETPALEEEIRSCDGLPASVSERINHRLLTCAEQEKCFRLFRAAAKREGLRERQPGWEETRRRLREEAFGLVIRARNSPGLGHAPRRLDREDCRCVVNGRA